MNRNTKLRRIIAVLLMVILVLQVQPLDAEDNPDRQPIYSDWWISDLGPTAPEYTFSGIGDSVLVSYLFALHGIHGYGHITDVSVDTDAVQLDDDLYLTAVGYFDSATLTVKTNNKKKTYTFILHNPGVEAVIPAGTEVTGENGSFKANGEIPAGTALSVGAFEPGEALLAALPQSDGNTQTVWMDIGLVDPAGNAVHAGADVTVKTNIALPAPPEGNPNLRTVVKSAKLYHVTGEDMVEELPVEITTGNGIITALRFSTGSFSGFALSYTVDFEYTVNGRTYAFTLPGGGFVTIRQLAEALGALPADTQAADRFIADIADVTFSDPGLVWTGKAEENATVSQIKTDFGLNCEYSADLSLSDIVRINASTVAAGEWLLISLKPFVSEETLTVTMKNGDQWTVQVTDAQEIPDAEKATIDPNKSYLICYEAGGVYYLLKNDGTVDSSHQPANFEHLNSTYAWTFHHIFKEQDVEHHLDKNYYLIRPIDDKSKTLALNYAGEALVQQSNNNVAVIQNGDGFILEGYHNVGTEDAHRYIHLGFNGTDFVGVDGDGVTIHIYEMDELPTYDYTVRSADEIRGTVSVQGGTQRDVTEQGTVVSHYWEASSTSDKMNGGTITAVPVRHMNQGQNKWLFDHWELDGLQLDRDQYPATIAPNTLPIPHNDSELIAYFRQNPDYVVPPAEKEPSTVEDMSGWLDELQNRNIPLDNASTKKTAEVYDYQNRIYRVDITSKANFETFAGNLDIAFCLDVSNSMYFPSALVKTTSANRPNPMPIYQINNSGWGWDNRGWLDRSRNWGNPYYLIADASGTATVFKIYYQDGNWKAQDASRTTESDKSFVIGENFETTWTKGANTGNHPFGYNDTDNTTYTIYDAGDNNRNRFHYLNQALSHSSSDLYAIKELLAVAGDESPDVKIAYNTFNKDLGNQRQNFITVPNGMTVNLNYASGGGTRPDQAFNDAQNFSWSADPDHRYVILVTDGAPQGIRTGEPKETTNAQIETWVRQAAQNLKNTQGVKFITVGLSMENVTSGKRLLYDLADNDSSGSKMFFLAENGSDLDNIFRKITKVLMEDAVVLGNVTDTVSEAFYLVDKATGLPLNPWDTVDLEGNRTNDPSKAAGVVQADGRTVKWTDQAIDAESGWHGTLYAKAQEELLGGNGLDTNAGDASVVATRYHVGGQEIPFDETLVRETLNLQKDLPTPKVNVNELTFFSNETEWTVYLGEEVDPKKQLQALYEGMVVEEVINENGSLHYSIGPNTIEERWDTATGTAKTFSLPDLLERLIRQDPAKTARYFTGSELNWDSFLEDMLSGGITLPYHEFGLTDGSNIKITLEKTVVSGEEDDIIHQSPHDTTVTGNEVEKYVLRVAYEPDYSVTPIGQGGQSTADFHTGTFGTMYQGHATGREASTNQHVINVYAHKLEVEKAALEAPSRYLSGAEFKLYKVDDENGQAVPGLDSAHLYVEVASAVTGADGRGIMKNGADDFEPVLGERYYLIETAAPLYYAKDETVWTVEVETSPGTFTDLEGNTLPSASGVTDALYPFNWDQDSRIVINDEPAAAVVKGEPEGTTNIITDGSFVPHRNVIAFRHTVLDGPLETRLPVPVKKILRGRDMKAGEFSFTLQPISIAGDRDDDGKQTVMNPPGLEDEPVTFNFSLNYDTEGIVTGAPYHDINGHAVYYYVVYEEQGEQETIVYSDLQYVVKVTLTQDDNGLVATPQFYFYNGEGPLPAEATENLQLSA